MADRAAVHVELFGKRLVWLKAADSSEGPLAYPEHVDEAGEVRLKDALTSLSYAHAGADGKIRRFRKVIGTVSDLVIINPE